MAVEASLTLTRCNFSAAIYTWNAFAGAKLGNFQYSNKLHLNYVKQVSQIRFSAKEAIMDVKAPSSGPSLTSVMKA